MPDEETLEIIGQLVAEMAAVRLAVAQVLAMQIRWIPDPEGALREMSEEAHTLIDRIPFGEAMGIDMVGTARDTHDAIMGTVQQMLDLE